MESLMGLSPKIIITRSNNRLFFLFGLPIFAIPAAKCQEKTIQPALSCVMVLTIDWLSLPAVPTNPVIKLMQSKLIVLKY